MKRRTTRFWLAFGLLVAVLGLTVTACGGEEEAAPEPTPPAEPAEPASRPSRRPSPPSPRSLPSRAEPAGRGELRRRADRTHERRRTGRRSCRGRVLHGRGEHLPRGIHRGNAEGRRGLRSEPDADRQRLRSGEAVRADPGRDHDRATTTRSSSSRSTTPASSRSSRTPSRPASRSIATDTSIGPDLTTTRHPGRRRLGLDPPTGVADRRGSSSDHPGPVR